MTLFCFISMSDLHFIKELHSCWAAVRKFLLADREVGEI